MNASVVRFLVRFSLSACTCLHSPALGRLLACLVFQVAPFVSFWVIVPLQKITKLELAEILLGARWRWRAYSVIDEEDKSMVGERSYFDLASGTILLLRHN